MRSLPFQIVYVCFGLSLLASPSCMLILVAVLPPALARPLGFLLPPVAFLMTSLSIGMIPFTSDRFYPRMLRVTLLINCFDFFSFALVP